MGSPIGKILGEKRQNYPAFAKPKKAKAKALPIFTLFPAILTSLILTTSPIKAQENGIAIAAPVDNVYVETLLEPIIDETIEAEDASTSNPETIIAEPELTESNNPNLSTIPVQETPSHTILTVPYSPSPELTINARPTKTANTKKLAITLFIASILFITSIMLWISRNKLARRLTIIKRQQNASKQNDEKYKLIFKSAVDGIYQINADGKIIDANPAMARILGYKNEAEILANGGLSLEQFYDDPFRWGQIRDALISQRSAIRAESIIRRRDGTSIWVSEHIRMYIDKKSGNPLYFEGHIEDITAQKDSENALILAKEEADMASRSKSEFLANMSHELRTPLNAIIGFAEIIKNEIFGEVGSPEYVDYSNDIFESGTHLLGLINDILDMSKIESGNRELNEGVVDLESVINSSLRIIRPRADMAGLQIHTNIAPNLPFIRAEERAMKQIVLNLLSNAVKFTEPAGEIFISLGMDRNGRIYLSIRDTGIGIKEEDIATVMMPFGQIESALSRQREGTGLGLPLVKSLTELHGGDLDLQSELGQGTTITIYLPQERAVLRETG